MINQLCSSIAFCLSNQSLSSVLIKNCISSLGIHWLIWISCKIIWRFNLLKPKRIMTLGSLAKILSQGSIANISWIQWAQPTRRFGSTSALKLTVKKRFSLNILEWQNSILCAIKEKVLEKNILHWSSLLHTHTVKLKEQIEWIASLINGLI